MGPIGAALDAGATKVARTVRQGEEFLFGFDFGDRWTHRCVVGEKVDPDEVLGIRPARPMAIWGWGAIPDQYGRRWEDDDGESPVPTAPAESDPMMDRRWPPSDQLPVLDMREVRTAVATADTPRFLAALGGREIDDALQQIAADFPPAMADDRAATEPIVLSFYNRLTWRRFVGNDVLAEDLLALLRGEPSAAPGRGHSAGSVPPSRRRTSRTPGSCSPTIARSAARDRRWPRSASGSGPGSTCSWHVRRDR